jgi:hypothetical protein
MKAGPQAKAFGKFLVTRLRDPAIKSFDDIAVGHSPAPSDGPIQQRLAKLDRETLSLVRECVVRALDGGIGTFLWNLQVAHDDESPDVVVVVDGQNVAAQSDGLHGEIWSEDGWFAKFSEYGEHGDGPNVT